MSKLNILIEKIVKDCINEFRYKDTATPINTRTSRTANLGYNPLSQDYGNHSNQDAVSQVSTIDYNGANFYPSDKLKLSDNKFMFYKVKHFKSDTISSTLDFFGKGSKAEKELRKAIDTLNGAAERNNKNLIYRIVTSDSNKELAEKTSFMKGAFWEFSFDNGSTWYILVPNPVQNMIQSKLVINK